MQDARRIIELHLDHARRWLESGNYSCAATALRCALANANRIKDLRLSGKIMSALQKTLRLDRMERIV